MPPIDVLVALADPTRCRIVEILRDGPRPVHVLAASFDISRPAISRHLRVLKQARLISEKKVGRENRYALHAGRLKPLHDWLNALAPAKASTPALARTAPAAPVARPDRTAKPAPAQTSEKPVVQMGFDF